MARIKTLASTATPQMSRFVGRAREVREFRDSVRYLLGKDTPPGGNPLFPRIFLPYGEGGMGKSMLLQRFRAIAIEEGWPEGSIVVADLDYEQFSTPEALAEKLVEAVRQKFSDFGSSYGQASDRRVRLGGRYRENQKRWARLRALMSKPGGLDEYCRQLRERLRLIELQIAPFGSTHAPLDLVHNKDATTEELAWLAAYEDNPDGVPATFQRFLTEEIGAEAAALFFNGEGVGKALAEDLFRLAENSPLLLAIDTYERADRLDDWMRTNVLAEASDRMLVVIAGRNQLDDVTSHIGLLCAPP